jgi:CHAD domain-containing protein
MARTPASELLLRQRLAALSRALPAAQRGDVRSIHRARVATRRLREALPLVAVRAKGRRIERVVQRITRALGPVRELDVALIGLGEIAASGAVPAPAIAPLRAVIGEERQRLHTEMQRRLRGVDLGRLKKHALAAERGELPRKRRGHPPDSRRLVAAEKRAARRAGALREAIEDAAGIYLPDRLHAVRIKVKKLRYATELSRELSRSRAVAVVRTLKQAQDLLGRMHDLEILIARTRAMQGSSSAANLRLSADLDILVRRLETECRLLHGRYMAMRRALLAACDRTEAAVVRRAAISAA